MSRVFLVSLIVLAALLAACGNQTAITPTQAPEKIVVYSGRSEKLVAPLFTQFTEATGIQVEVRYGDTAELAATILEEGPNSPADLYLCSGCRGVRGIGSRRDADFTTLHSSRTGRTSFSLSGWLVDWH